jgi:hypothetical protein
VAGGHGAAAPSSVEASASTTVASAVERPPSLIDPELPLDPEELEPLPDPPPVLLDDPL